MDDQSLQLSSMASVREDLGLVEEMQETVRRLLQHCVFVSLLAIRLYTLPLMYFCYKLSQPEDLWPSSTWSCITRAHSIYNRHWRFSVPRSPSAFRSILRLVVCGFFKPFKIMTTLYRLGKLVEIKSTAQHLACEVHPQPKHNAIDVRNERLPTPRRTPRSSLSTMIEAPATASQVYHAALLNGNTLDNILAAFESVESDTSSSAEVSPATPKRKHDHNDLQRSNSSIQTTPERMLTPKSTFDLPKPEANTIAAMLDYRTKSSPAMMLQDITPQQVMINKDSKSNTSKSRSCCEEMHLNAHIHSGENVVTTDLKRCPTFVRRHANSKLPRKSAGSDKQVIHAPIISSHILAASTDSFSPSKRAKLQRRIRIYRDA